MEIEGKGFHRSLRISIELDERNHDHHQYYLYEDENHTKSGIKLKDLKVLLLMEIEKNSYYFDYYDLEYRTGFPAKKVTLFSRSDFIPYEMIGNTTFDELLDCHKVIGKETALNLLSNSSTEFLGIELFSPYFIKNTYGKDLLEFSVPIHFNYQQAVLDDRKYIKIHLYPILSFIHYSSNQSLSVASDSSFPEINRLFQRSNLGNERPLANTYYQQLTDSIQNGSYQFLGVSPFCTDQTTVLIPVGNVSDYVWVAPVTSSVTIACLLALIIKVIVMIRESILIIYQKVAAEKKSE